MKIAFVCAFNSSYHFEDVYILMQRAIQEKATDFKIVIVQHPVPYIDVDPIPSINKMALIMEYVAPLDKSSIKVEYCSYKRQISTSLILSRLNKELDGYKVYCGVETNYNSWDLVSIDSSYIIKTPFKYTEHELGIFAAVKGSYPVAYPTVDVAVLVANTNDQLVILGRKEGQDKYRFPGGFFDAEDVNLETAAIREVKEEMSININDVRRVSDIVIKDWRYEHSKNDILTTLFIGYTSDISTLKASDDLCEVLVIKIEDLKQNYKDKLVSNHVILFEHLLKALN